MKILTTLLLFFTAFTAWGQESVTLEFGIGFAVATNSYQFEDGSHYKNIYSDKGLKNKIKKTLAIGPYFYKPDYGLYHFICTEKTNFYYKILINDTTLAYIPNDSSFYFMSWETILFKGTLERFSKDNPIREEPENDSPVIQNNCKADRLKVAELIEKENEYWAYVSFDTLCNDYPSDKPILKYGRIKWRTKNKLLVSILLLC